MKLTLLYTTLAIIIVSCNNQNPDDYNGSRELVPNPEGSAKDKVIVEETETHELLLTSGSTLEEAEKIELSGVDFSIVRNESGDTTYWQTSDYRFITKEGYKVGDSWNDIPEEVKNELFSVPGWGYLIHLDSGWTLAFCEGETCTEHEPTADSKVDWIYKRI